MKKVIISLVGVIAVSALWTVLIKHQNIDEDMENINDFVDDLPAQNAQIALEEPPHVKSKPEAPQTTTNNLALHPLSKPSEQVEPSKQTSNSCKAIDDDFSPATEEVTKYLSSVLGWDTTSTEYNEYALYDEETLNVLAESGDAQAMLTLGLIYRSYSIYDQFSSAFLSPVASIKNIKKREKLDSDIMKKSIYWLNQAAYHGIPAALMEQLQAYQILINEGQADALVPNDEALIVHRKAVRDFNRNVNPNFENLNFLFGSTIELDESQLEQYNQRRSQLDAQWKVERERLNKPLKIEIDVTDETLALVNTLKCHFES